MYQCFYCFYSKWFQNSTQKGGGGGFWCLVPPSTKFKLVLLLGENGIPGENHWPVASHRQTQYRRVMTNIVILTYIYKHIKYITQVGRIFYGIKNNIMVIGIHGICFKNKTYLILQIYDNSSKSSIFQMKFWTSLRLLLNSVKINEKSISHGYKTGKVLADNLLIINTYIQYILHLNKM